jgi:hypothetical protein
MLEPSKMPEDMAKFLRTSWETYLKLLETVQGQTEKVMEMMLEQSDNLRSDGKQMLKQWTEMMKQSQVQYKKMMEDNLDKLESMFKKE